MNKFGISLLAIWHLFKEQPIKEVAGSCGWSGEFDVSDKRWEGGGGVEGWRAYSIEYYV